MKKIRTLNFKKSLMLMITPALFACAPVSSFQHSTPKTITPQLTSGPLHLCGLTPSGSIQCWGNNTSGQLGDGTTTLKTSPTQIPARSTYQALSAGNDHTCGLTTEGQIKCWGNNRLGQLGDGSQTQRTRERHIQSDSKYIGVSSGGDQSCAVSTSHELMCWGKLQGNPPNPAGIIAFANRPHRQDELTQYQAVSVGVNHSCGITLQGRIKCWGNNTSGQLGDRTQLNRAAPSEISADQDTTYQSVTAGASHTCAITHNGTLQCWGSNEFGQLGEAVGDTHTSPISIDPDTKYLQVSLGNSHTCGITTAHKLKCWGRNASGQIGNGESGSGRAVRRPTEIDDQTIYESITAAGSHTCGVTTTRIVKCWGSNEFGHLGAASPEPIHTPRILGPLN